MINFIIVQVQRNQQFIQSQCLCKCQDIFQFLKKLYCIFLKASKQLTKFQPVFIIFLIAQYLYKFLQSIQNLKTKKRMFQQDDLEYLFDNNQEEEYHNQYGNNNNGNTNSKNNMFSNNNKQNHYQNDRQRQSNSNNHSFSHTASKQQEKKKFFMPQQFNKGKRTLNKIILNYFNELKDQYCKYPTTATIYNKFDQIQNVVTAIRRYVGIKHQKKQFLDIKIMCNNKKPNNELRNGLFCYQSQVQKIINYSRKGVISEIKVNPGKLKLPSMATPVPFRESIYFFDPINFDKTQKMFFPDKISYKVTEKGQLQELKPSPSLQRMKCAIVRDQKNIFLIGGYQGQNKYLTRRCQKYFPIQKRFEQMPELNNRHNFPSAIILKEKIWVFSQNYIQYFFKNQWRNVQKPFGLTIYPFQFLAQLTSNEILIFGGVKHNRKVTEVQIFNTDKLYSDSYDQILPQGICSQRVWGPTYVQNNIVALSNMQAEVYPQVGTKKNVLQVIYITSNGLFLHSLITQN